VPVLGHERGFSASTIGFVLGSFTLSVTAVRVLIPVLAHHVREVTVLRAAMVRHRAGVRGVSVRQQPVADGRVGDGAGRHARLRASRWFMSGLHHLTPASRHGEAIALRSIVINLSSTTLPLVFWRRGRGRRCGGVVLERGRRHGRRQLAGTAPQDMTE